MRNIELEIRQIIADILDTPVEKVHLNSNDEDLGMDSLDMIETIMTVESNFNFEISDDVADKFQTVNDLVEHVNRNSIAEATIPDPLPLIEDWNIDNFRNGWRSNHQHLHGVISNDPLKRFKDGDYITTSPIVTVDMEKGLVQTRNTLYRLGTPYGGPVLV